MEDSDSYEAIGHLSMMADAAHIMANMHTMAANKQTTADGSHPEDPQAPTQEFVEKNDHNKSDKPVLDNSPIGLNTPDVVDNLRSPSDELETHVGLKNPDTARTEPISFQADEDIISDTPVPYQTGHKERDNQDGDGMPVPFHIDDKDDNVPATTNRDDTNDKETVRKRELASRPIAKAEYFDVSDDELPSTGEAQEDADADDTDEEHSSQSETSPSSPADADHPEASYTPDEPYLDTEPQSKVIESLSLGPDGQLIHETKGSTDPTLGFGTDEQVGEDAANLLLSIANTEPIVKVERPVVKVERTEEDDLNDDMMAEIVEQHKNAQEEDGEAFTMVDVEAGPPFRQDICKALESVCRRVFQATKFIRITGDLHFSVDDVETVRMPDVSHTIEVVKVVRSKRGRPRKTPSLFSPAINYRELSDAEEDLPPGKRIAVAQSTEMTAEKLFQCEHCDYSTRHEGFYKKHLRVKHTDPQEGPAPRLNKVPRKRGRPRKNTPMKKKVTILEDTDEEEEKIVEPDHVESGSEGGDNESQDTTFEPKFEGPDDETTPKRETRSSGPCKFKCDQCSYETDHSGHYRDHLNRHAGVKPHQCPQCPKSFIRLDDLKKHSTVHERKWVCATCGVELEDKVGLKEHMKDVHHETGPLQLLGCDICKQKLATQAELTKHMDTKHNHICGICGENFTFLKQLQKHKREVHPRECLTCTICLKSCVSKGALRKHMHKHRHGSAFPCDICQRIFTTQSSLYHHKRGVHANLRAYKCTQCDKSFNFHHSLKLHMLKHQGLRPYKCEVCEKTYLTATHLKSHVNAVHSDTKKFPCPICNKRFPYENSLRQHMMLHTGDRPFLCNICGRGFVNNSALKTHEASHVDSKEWQCDICKKMYKTEALMRAHQRRHTDQGSRFMCDICGHTFMYKSNLEAHSTVHSGERNYNCKECGCTFKTAATLYSHRLVHKTETPHNCVICGKAFKSKERKLAHEKRHMGDKPFQCEVCGRAFPDKGGLSKHTKTVHSRVKRFVCPVCKKTCSRADNLRVHMRIHRDPDLLKMDWKMLMTNEMEDGSDNMEYFGSSQQAGPAQGPQMGHQVGSEGTSGGGSMPPMSGTSTPQLSSSHSSHGHLQMAGPTTSHHTSRDSLQPFDLRQPPNMQQPADLRQNAPLHQHRHPSHHPGHQGPHHPGVLVVPEPNLQHHLHSSYQPGMGGSSAQHIAAAMSALLPPGHGLPPPPPAHHQHSGGLQPSSGGQDYDTISQDNMRTIQVIMPPAAHSGTEDGGGQGGPGQLSHAMRDYAEHAMLFMQYQSNTHHQ